MTYRELIEICYKTPNEECDDCSQYKECRVFIDKTNGEFPAVLHSALNINLDAEIEV